MATYKMDVREIAQANREEISAQEWRNCGTLDRNAVEAGKQYNSNESVGKRTAGHAKDTQFAKQPNLRNFSARVTARYFQTASIYRETKVEKHQKMEKRATTVRNGTVPFDEPRMKETKLNWKSCSRNTNE